MPDEAVPTKRQRLFDRDTYVEKIRVALAKIEKQPPAPIKRLATKSELLIESKPLLQGLINKGYSIGQIADALGHDVFKILPKAINDVLKQGVPKDGASAYTRLPKKPGRPRGSKKSAIGEVEPNSNGDKPVLPGLYEAKGDRADNEL